MNRKTTIVISGIGGVGGYIGGMLAAYYKNQPNVEIVFVVRKGKAEPIKQHGLKLMLDNEPIVVFPDFITDDPATINHIDYLICATKGYDLEENMMQYQSVVDANTVILPLLNGVDAQAIIQKILPQTKVWNGCMFIVARLLEPGVVSVTGPHRILHFGSSAAHTERLQQFQSLLAVAGIDARLSQEIESTVWEKYLFISPFASLTTSLNLPMSELLQHPEPKAVLLTMLSEIHNLAQAMQIKLPENIIPITISKMENIAPGVLSSLHHDFLKGGKMELQSLTEYVIENGKRHGIPTPTYNVVFNRILSNRLKLN